MLVDIGTVRRWRPGLRTITQGYTRLLKWSTRSFESWCESLREPLRRQVSGANSYGTTSLRNSNLQPAPLRLVSDLIRYAAVKEIPHNTRDQANLRTTVSYKVNCFKG